MKTKALIYCRVSSQRQVDEGNGLGSQEQRCRMYAKSKDYEVVQVFPDEAISGSLFQRPAMHDLLSYIDDHPHDNYVVIFDDLSRYARDVKVHIQLTAEFQSRGVKRECLNFNFEDSDESEMAELMVAVSNQYQRKSNRRQVIQKMKARLEKGYWAFMPPVALENKKDPIHGKILTPVEPHASLLKGAIEQYRDALLTTQENVMHYLHEAYEAKGLPERFALHTVQQILKNPLYAGHIEYKPWNVPFMKARHEGFISIQTYNAVQDRLLGRGKPWKRKDYHLDFPLRPHVLCEGCNIPMTGSYNTGRNKIRYPHYFCRTKSCMYVWKTTSKETYEKKFEELLISKKPSDDVAGLTQDVLLNIWNNRLDLYSQGRESMQIKLGKVKEDIDGFAKLANKAQSDMLRNVYENKILELSATEKKLEHDLQNKDYTEKDFGTASKKVLTTLTRPMELWQSPEYNDKRIILFMYFENKLRYDYKRGFGTATLARPVEIIREIGTSKMSSVEMSSSELECKELH